MIKCSKSIYSYIDDLVIANCLIDARMVVHALPHISFVILLCEHVGCIIFLIRGHPFVALIAWSLFFLPNGWTRMPKNSLAIYAFLFSDFIHATSQSLI